MDAAEMLVTAGGGLGMAWTVWYFFLAERRQVRASVETGGVQRVRVTVKGGYEPDVIVVEKDRPVRLEFDRQENAGCSDTVVLGDFGIARSLPPFQTTVVEFLPRQAGEFVFTCGMNMLRGKLIVEDAKPSDGKGH